MAYADGFVVTILHNGKTLRETNSIGERVVRLPFGSEYALRIQNKTKKRAYVSVAIDGTGVLSGKLVMKAGEKIDLERFCLDGDLTKGNKFKFVEAGNSAVQDPTSEDNGNVVVTFEPEMDYSWFTLATPVFKPSALGGVLRGMSGQEIGSQCFINSVNSSSTQSGTTWSASASSGATLTSASLSASPQVATDVGATVEGAASSQKFKIAHEWFSTETPVTIGIRLKGMVQESAKPWSINLGQTLKVMNNGVTLSGINEIQFTASEAVVLMAGSKIRIPLDQVKIS